MERDVIRGRARRGRGAVVAVAVAAFLAGSCNGHLVSEDTFAARTDVEKEAKARMQHWVQVAELVLEEPSIPQEERAKVRAGIAAMRAALSRYSELRSRGMARGLVMAPLEAAATGLVADDATGVGLGNDILLLPLALAAMATYVITDARATEHELAQAWNQVLTESGRLATLVESALVAASLGSRQGCIDEYVNCQQHARRSFPRGQCQVCMHRCIVSDFVWPPGEECKYR